MPFDGLMLTAIKSELSKTLVGAKIDKIYQPAKTDIVLNIRHHRERFRLLLSAHSRDARVHLSTQPNENPTQPPTFCMVLRKHLEGGSIKEIEQPGLERVLKIHVAARDELGRPSEKLLICEIMGKHSNILLVDPTVNIITDGIRRYSHEVSRHREVLPGRPYIPAPAQNKLNPLQVDEDTFRNVIFAAPLENRVVKVLQNGFEGLSTVMAREIVFRAQLSEELAVNYCGEHEMRVLWQALQSLSVPASNGQFQSTIIEDNNKNPVEFAAFDLTILEGYTRHHGSPSEIADNFFAAVKLIDRFKGEIQSLKTKLNKEVKRLKKKMSLQTESADTAQKAENYRVFGELLTANIYRLDKGNTEIEVNNFYDPEGKSIVIPLDARLSPAANAQSYFKKYVKAKKTRKAALEQARKSKAELDYLQGVLLNVEQATSLVDLSEIRQELIEQGYIGDKNHKAPTKKEKKKAASPPLPFKSSDGFSILVGRNNKQNDRLTMKLAKDNDIWLHTKDIPGSHVIIKTQGMKVPDHTIHQAAVIAAFYSQARNSQNVPVDYTPRKNVKKPRGAKPGYVIYEQQRTAVVTPDAKLISSLEQKY